MRNEASAGSVRFAGAGGLKRRLLQSSVLHTHAEDQRGVQSWKSLRPDLGTLQDPCMFVDIGHDCEGSLYTS